MKIGWSYNVVDTGIGTSPQRHQTNNQAAQVQCPQHQVLGRVPLALAHQQEPHQRGEVEGEARDEERRGDGQQIREEGNDLGDHKCHPGDDGDQGQPGDPAHLGVDEANGRVLEDAPMDHAAQHHRVDRTTDEDDGQRNPKRHTLHHAPGGQQGGALHILTNKGVDQRTRQRVDDDFNETQRPDGFDVVLGGVHLIHERELAHGETVGEDNVGDGNEGVREGDALLGPSGPVHPGQTRRAVGSRDSRGNHGDQDSGDYGDKVDVAQNSHLSETGRDGEEQQDDGGDDGEHDGADAAFGNVNEGDGTRQAVGARQEEQLQTQHHVDNLVTNPTEHQPSRLGVVGDVGELQLDLTDHVTGVDGDKTQTHGQDDTGNHTKGSETAGNGQTTQRNGLDDQHNRQALPSQTVVLFDTGLVDVPLALAHLLHQVTIVLLTPHDILGLVVHAGDFVAVTHDDNFVFM